MSEDCVFCRIIEGEIDAEIVHETEEWMAFLDSNPVSRGHTLVVPKQHVEDIHGASGMDFMWEAITRTADAVKEAMGAEAININQNNGSLAGQEVFHLHFHVTPRYDGSEISIEYDRDELENGESVAAEIGSKMT